MKKIVFSIMVIILLILSPMASYGDGDVLETYGSIGQIALPIAALAMTVARNDNEGTGQFVKAFATTMAVTYVLKYTIDSERPRGGDHSFPSGHTAAAFAGAGFIQQRYGWGYGLPAYAAAALVGMSRVTSDNHYIRDVVAGAAIAIGANLVFTKKFEEKTIAITPVKLNKGVGVIVTYSW